MKRSLGLVIGVVGIGTVVYFGSRLLAQQPNPVPPPTGAPVAAQPLPLRTPVRIVNVSHVIKNYHRWKNFQGEYKAKYKADYQDKLENSQKALQNLAAKMQNPATPVAEKEMAQKEGRRIEREMQELGEDAKLKLGKMQADAFVRIYREVEDTVRDYARASGIELVVHYSDATEEPDLHSGPNIERKLGNGACIPMYAAPGMDISANVLQIMNSRVPLLPPVNAGAAATPGVPAPGTTVPRPQPGTVPQPGVIQPTSGFQRPPN